MSETMPNPTEWMQFYSPNFSGSQGATTTTHHSTLFPDRVSDATVVTTAAAATELVGSGSSSPSAAAGTNRLSPEGGRVSKPVRRRSRASRRTPTTLLNTDTTNFRAMVQQFTGGPTAPFANSGAHPGGPGFAFGLGARQNFVNPSAGMVPAAALAGYNYHHQPPQQQNIYQQQYPFSLSTGTGDDSFVQRLSSGRPVMGNMGVSTEDFLMGVTAGISGSQVAAARPSSNSANENRSNNFMF
ncbi:VQ motif-containing protein 22-like [Humulus lupulus]|uniref:VQ motif-containing protein 22-like n=1 Tax=Humulus lupulus TaxID=3486 RepID=UPI002B4074E0|nr:VQ motif-containing protein 22-like [Humulus lupulus]